MCKPTGQKKHTLRHKLPVFDENGRLPGYSSYHFLLSDSGVNLIYKTDYVAMDFATRDQLECYLKGTE